MALMYLLTNRLTVRILMFGKKRNKMHMHTTEVKSEPEDAEDHSLFTSRIRKRDADSDADSGKNTDTETFLDIQEFVTQFFPFRNHYSEEKEQMNKHIRGEKEEPMKDRIWDVRLPFAPSSIKRVSDTSDNQKVYKNSSEKLLKMTEIRKVVDSPDARLPCESTPNTSVPIIDISDDKEVYQNTPKENQPSHDSTEKLLKVTEIRKEIIDSPDTGDFTQSSCMNDPASNDYKFGEERNSSFMRIQQKKVKYMRKFGLANSAERRKRQQEKRKEYMEYQRLMAFANSSKGRETKEKTKEDFTPSLCMNDPVADIVSESEVQYICSLGRNKQNSSESTLMKQISEEREKKKKPFSCMKDLRELEECFLESQDIFENNLRVIEAKAAEKRSEKKSILCEKCNKDVTRGRKLLCEEPDYKSSNRSVRILKI
ncbi:hypothetical protein CDAR_285381 [Caerostris darwini]|uniref:Uncharacterized protein n=1 Tax=Caerostris darwini TaxID=1538125 RepID=A0AAV4T048_9ARAC|nr:hypothetical protein CDAR_285381 [Caerostris darwini]